MSAALPWPATLAVRSLLDNLMCGSALTYVGKACFALAAAVLAEACGGATAGGDTAPGRPVSIEEFPGAAAHAVCDHFGACCGQVNVPFDSASCLSTRIAVAQAELAARGSRRYDPAAGGACVADLLEVATTCSGFVERNDACGWKLLLGTVPPGGSCQQPNECVPPAICAGTPSICVATPFAKLGEPFIATCLGDDMNEVFSCAGATAASGPVCSSDQNLTCASDGTCHALPDPDGPGTNGDACSAQSGCNSGLYCDATSSRCRARKPPFASCQSDEQCLDPSTCAGGTCGFALTFICTGMAPHAN